MVVGVQGPALGQVAGLDRRQVHGIASRQAQQVKMGAFQILHETSLAEPPEAEAQRGGITGANASLPDRAASLRFFLLSRLVALRPPLTSKPTGCARGLCHGDLATLDHIE